MAGVAEVGLFDLPVAFSDMTVSADWATVLPRLEVKPITSRVATALAVEHHYLHRRPPISHAFGIFYMGMIVGVCTFGTPASRHLQKSACPSDPALVIELNRLWVADSMPRNIESWFVSRCLRALPPMIVVSYADTREQHYGFIYRALNFHYAGWTDMDRKTPRKDYIPFDSSAHTREAFRTGYSHTVPRLPKVKYWIATGTPLQRRFVARLCGWPTLSWIETPPPAYAEPAIAARATA